MLIGLFLAGAGSLLGAMVLHKRARAKLTAERS
jgi:hypothetical protein